MVKIEIVVFFFLFFKKFFMFFCFYNNNNLLLLLVSYVFFISVFIGSFLKSWLGWMIWLIYVGGIIILFKFSLSIHPNLSSVKSYYINLFLAFPLFLFFQDFYCLGIFNLNSYLFKKFLVSKFICKDLVLLFFVMLIFLWLVNKVNLNNKSSLRPLY